MKSTRSKPTGSLIRKKTCKPKKKKIIKKKKYTQFRKVGAGTFGSVYRAKTADGKTVAIKRVMQDPHYKNRELDILKSLKSQYCIKMIDYYITKRNSGKDVFLNIVMNFFPYSMHTYLRHLRVDNLQFEPTLMKVYIYQMFAGLKYLHSNGIVHRDIKPENLMISTTSGRLKLCDFGSAKRIGPDERSIAYIASRYYRAPELVLGCQKYSGAVDVWAAGCVAAEMLMKGTALFEGESGIEQIKPIIRILGVPKQEDLDSFDHDELPKFSEPQRIIPLESILPKGAPIPLIRLLNKIFVYNPKKRITAQECLKCDYFADLFEEGKMIPGLNRPISPLLIHN